MRTHLVVMAPPSFDDHLRFGSRSKPLEAQALVAEFAIEAFRDAVLPGLPGSINAVPMPWATIQDNRALDTNSGPLSLRRKAGAPRALTSCDSTSITRGQRMRPST
jgi:hypothetical protein